MEKRFENIAGARARYGGSAAAWRKWVRTNQLGCAVVRFGKLVFVDSQVLDERLAKTGQLLVERSSTAKATLRDSGTSDNDFGW